MSTASTLLAAAAGACAGLASALVAARSQMRQAVFRRQAELEAERDREARLAVATLAGLVSRALQTIDWFTWEAAKPNTSLDSSAVQDYDQAMKDHLPNVMDALAKVAALSGEGFSRFRPFVLDMFSMDRDVSDAVAEIDIDRTETIRRLAAFDHASDDLFDRFNAELADWANARAREV